MLAGREPISNVLAGREPISNIRGSDVVAGRPDEEAKRGLVARARAEALEHYGWRAESVLHRKV